MPGTKGKSGPKPKPDAVKALAGTLRADRVNDAQPVIAAFTEVPECPYHLKGVAKRAWGHTASVLVGMGVLTQADLHGLEAYCSVYARWRAANVQLGKSGMPVPSPHQRVVEDCLKQMRAWMVEFGLTPSSRSRVKVEKKESSPSDEDWFNVRRN